MNVRPKDGNRDDEPEAPRVRRAVGDEQERQREQRHGDQLGTQGHRRRRHRECAQRQPRREPDARPLATA